MEDSVRSSIKWYKNKTLLRLSSLKRKGKKSKNLLKTTINLCTHHQRSIGASKNHLIQISKTQSIFQSVSHSDNSQSNQIQVTNFKGRVDCSFQKFFYRPTLISFKTISPPVYTISERFPDNFSKFHSFPTKDVKSSLSFNAQTTLTLSPGRDISCTQNQAINQPL